MIRHILLIWLVSIVSSCSWSVDTDLAELAVGQFHESFNRGSFQTIYTNASPEFQNYVTKDKFIRLLTKLRSGIGQHKSSNLINWSAKSSLGGGTAITLVYNAQYEYDDKAKESFTFQVNDGLAKLYNFNVSSEVLSKLTDI